MIARIRNRLNDMEQRHPLRYAVVLVLACDVVLIVAFALIGAFA